MSKANGQQPLGVSVLIDPATGTCGVQTNIPDAMAVMRALAMGMIRWTAFMEENFRVAPRSALVLADGSPAPTGNTGDTGDTPTSEH